MFASGVSTLVMSLRLDAATAAVFGSRIRPIDALTSAEVNGSPSCQVTPVRRLKVIVLPSAEVSHLAARDGISLPSLSVATRPL